MKYNRCQAKTQLIMASQAAVEAYSKAVRDLSNTIGNASHTEFEKINLAAIQARKVSLKARTELNVHTREHGC